MSTSPSETSPLLPRTGDGTNPNALPPVETEPRLATRRKRSSTSHRSGEPPRNSGNAGHNRDAERQSPEDEEGPPKGYEGLPEVKKRMHIILPAMAIGIFLSAADQTIIVSSYGKIGTDLHALNKTSWIATAYFLTLTSFQPLYGKLSDIFSRKSCLLFGYVVFGLGCVACGLARDINELIAARAFAGIGGGAMTTVVSIILSDAIELRERGKWQGYLNIIYAAGAASGAPLGGILAQYLSWRITFLAQGPMCLLAIIAVSALLHLPKQDSSNWREKLRRIDFLGAIILVAAVFFLLLGLDRGSNVAWRDNLTVAALCTAIPLFALFLLVEIKVAAEPFAPGHIIFERSLFACYLCNFFSFGGWLAALFYIPLYFQAVGKYDATHAGLLMIPSVAAGVSGSLFGGFYMQKTDRYYWLTVIAYANLVVGMILILLFAGVIARSDVGIVIGMVINGFANGIGVTTTLIALIANVDPSDQAVATACTYLFRQLGSVFGVAISATVANQSLRSTLETALRDGDDASRIAEGVRESLEFIYTLRPAVQQVVRDCYAYSTRAAFGVQIVIATGAAVFAWFIREKTLSR